MNFTLNQKISVTDKKNGKVNPAKVMNLDVENNTVEIHYMDWHSRYDEVLPCDSDRIVKVSEKDSAASSNVVASPVCTSQTLTKEVLGNLLRHVNENQKTVLSSFEENENFEKNEKNLNKFLVPMLEETSEYLGIVTVDREEKGIQ